jgi:acetyl-CoA carboxylase, biotin carboxylase subunit
VKEMIRIAGGARLSFAQQDVTLNGHAIECRINAEDPAADFRPSPGTITELSVPEAEHIRFDAGVYAGYTVPPFYDSLLGKLIVWGPTRHEALARARTALHELNVRGIKTTVGLHAALARDPQVIALNTHTRWLEQWLERHPLGAPLAEVAS